jgi:prepilin-type N-terminal cleavage/methylation domain-containing protein
MLTTGCARTCAVAKRRRGFTLIELLLALVLLDVGIVALVGASAAVARVESGAHADARALETASARIERMLAMPCNGSVAATAHPAPDLVESWTDTPAPNDTREVSDSVVRVSTHGPRVLVLRSAGRC